MDPKSGIIFCYILFFKVENSVSTLNNTTDSNMLILGEFVCTFGFELCVDTDHTIRISFVYLSMIFLYWGYFKI